MLCCVKSKASSPEKEDKFLSEGKKSPSRENLVEEDFKKDNVHTNKAFEEASDNGKASKSPREKSKSRSPSKEVAKKKEKELKKEQKKEKSKSPSPAKENGKNNNTKTKSPAKEVKNGHPDRTAQLQAERQQSVSPDQVVIATNASYPTSGVIATDYLQQQQPLNQEEEIDEAMAAELSSLISRLETVTSRLETVASGSGGSGDADGPDAAFVQEFDATVKGFFSNFMQLSSTIGEDVKTQAGLVEVAFNAQRDVLVLASKAKKPSDADLVKILTPLSQKITAIQEFREKNRPSKQFNHLSAISESVTAFAWVSMSPTPAPFVKEMADAGQFYSNRVLKDFRDKDKTHVDWVKSWFGMLTELQTYIKKSHTTGLSWNPKGKDATSVGGAPAPPPPAGGGPPPPPPPGPPPPPEVMPGANTGGGGESQRANLLAELNKGADITSGLKKVKADQQTHKNPNLRLHGPAPYKPNVSPKPSRVKAPGAPAQAPVKPPKIELEGKKWVVENHNGNKNIVIGDTNLKQTVYVFKCNNSTINVKGKVNSIVLDTCKKTALVFEDTVSGIEIVNCQSVQTQVTGKVPTISVDKTDGFMIYLSKDSLDAIVVSAKSSEMNVLVPDASGEYKEYAIPEQFRTSWNGSKLVTEPTDIVA